MDITEFWSLIEGARAHLADTGPDADSDGKAVSAFLVQRLAGTSELTIFEFEQHFTRLHAALLRWDVWAAAYLINRGCSDDSFMDFRAALIVQGQPWYERVLAEPDALAEHPEVRSVAAGTRGFALFQEIVNYIAAHAYEQLTGGDQDGEDELSDFHEAYGAFAGPARPEPEDLGEDFDFDDPAEMRARLPRLAELFLTGR